MGLFGWDYPPGCHSVPGDEPEPPCEVCGGLVDTNDREKECICPECPQCGAFGDPKCYEQHGMVKTEAQVVGRGKLDEWYAAEAEADRQFGEAMAQKEKDDQEFFANGGFGQLVEERAQRPCAHGVVGPCNACDYLGDLAYDAAREARFMGRR